MNCGVLGCIRPSSSNFCAIIHIGSRNKYVNFCSMDCKRNWEDKRCAECRNDEDIAFDKKEEKYFCVSSSLPDCYSIYKGYNASCKLCKKLLRRDYHYRNSRASEDPPVFFCHYCQTQLERIQNLEKTTIEIREKLVDRIHKHNSCENCSCSGQVMSAECDLKEGFATLLSDSNERPEIFKDKLQRE